MQPPKPIYSYIAAAALAIVTIFSFYVFQDFGPQSVIRRFHVDVARGEFREMNSLTTEGLTSPATRQMIEFVSELAKNHASYEIVNIKSTRGGALAAVEYRFPNGFGKGIIWHVKKTRTEWRIECGNTIAGILQQAGSG